jgi:UDP-N-acetylmuramoyl-L-alanyl-D-glutamate--2,6-diaminopimelate ligase
VVIDPSPRRRLALVAARFYGTQPETVVAVTGTNGKTSVVGFTRQLFAALGRPAAALGTLGLESPSGRIETGLTTIDPIRLHALLAGLAEAGVSHLALEASSHGLDQHRLDGVRLVAAAFTNLSRDHLDYHASVDDYFSAKRRLFAELLPEGTTAVLNADDDRFGALRVLAAARGLSVIDYGRAAGRIRLLELTPTGRGQALRFALDGEAHEVELGLLGAFQASNVLAALGLVLATGEAARPAIEALSRLEGAPGRLEPVGRLPNGALILVDFAHTPDALGKALEAVRPHTRGKLVVVFGAGGDRDPGKRGPMGEAVGLRADRAIVTDDNPRSEDPAAIRRQVLGGCPGALEVGDRAEAIRTAIESLAEGDLLVIAGKGHESGQVIGDDVLPFSDAAVAREAIRAAAHGGRA